MVQGPFVCKSLRALSRLKNDLQANAGDSSILQTKELLPVNSLRSPHASWKALFHKSTFF